jgi:hypothetical protein
VLPQAVAIAANRHDVAVMDEPIDPHGGHCTADTQMNPNLARAWASSSERSRWLSDLAGAVGTEGDQILERVESISRRTHGRESRLYRDIRT